MEISDILRYVSYRPKTILKGSDGNTLAEFRKFKSRVPRLEVSGDSIRFEIASTDAAGTAKCTPKCSIRAKVANEKDLVSASRKITKSLHGLYSEGSDR